MHARPYGLILILILSLLACCTAPNQSPTTLSDAVTARSSAARPVTDRTLQHEDDILARVNGQSIPKSRFMNLLVRSHGASLLEQIVVHDAAEQLAARRNLVVTPADVDREYELALRRLLDPAGLADAGEYDRPLAEQLLTTLLSERNISRDEFVLGMKRNAYLRKIVNADTVISEADLQAEFAAACAERAQVRLIQVATLATASEIRDALARGEDFSSLAGRYSTNQASAKLGGQLPPFSRDDVRVPVAIREAAFALKPGETSAPIRMGEWFHLIRLDAILPARELNFADVREELMHRIRDRRAPEKMEELYNRLLQNAGVDIEDPALRAEYRQRVRGRVN